jgi:hypothetical protein
MMLAGFDIEMRTAVLALLVGAALPACDRNGTETDNPAPRFKASYCKKPGEGEPLTLADAGARASDKYAGLECLAWSAERDHFHVEIYNMIGGCHVLWEDGGSRLHDGILDLAVRSAYEESGECIVSACIADCPYDLIFDFDDIPERSAFLVTLRTEDCHGETEGAARPYSTLRSDGASEGIACIPARGVWYDCGGNHLRCCGGDTDRWTCEDGLSCQGSRDGEVCLAPCTVDGDCPLPDVETCREGFCRVPDHF